MINKVDDIETYGSCRKTMNVIKKIQQMKAGYDVKLAGQIMIRRLAVNNGRRTKDYYDRDSAGIG